MKKCEQSISITVPTYKLLLALIKLNAVKCHIRKVIKTKTFLILPHLNHLNNSNELYIQPLSWSVTVG